MTTRDKKRREWIMTNEIAFTGFAKKFWTGSYFWCSKCHMYTTWFPFWFFGLRCVNHAPWRWFYWGKIRKMLDS